MKHFLLLLFIIFTLLLQATNISYEVSMSAPHTHYYEVKMSVQGYDKEYFDIQMPTWSPGSYLIREYSKNVEELSAIFNKKLLKIEK